MQVIYSIRPFTPCILVHHSYVKGQAIVAALRANINTGDAVLPRYRARDIDDVYERPRFRLPQVAISESDVSGEMRRKESKRHEKVAAEKALETRQQEKEAERASELRRQEKEAEEEAFETRRQEKEVERASVLLRQENEAVEVAETAEATQKRLRQEEAESARAIARFEAMDQRREDKEDGVDRSLHDQDAPDEVGSSCYIYFYTLKAVHRRYEFVCLCGGFNRFVGPKLGRMHKR